MSDIVTGLYDRAIGADGDALLMDAADEIERLQADLAATRIAFEDWKVMHSTAALEAEIERLRETIEAMAIYNGTQLVEIERLRSLVYCYPPTEFAPEGQTWQQEAEKLRHRVLVQEAEIERRNDGISTEILKLRGLLRECIEWVEFKEDGGLRYAHGAPYLVKRVREALYDVAL